MSMVNFVGNLIAWFASYGLQALVFFAAALVIVLVGLPLMYALRAILRQVAPYETPPYGQYRGFRYWLENL